MPLLSRAMVAALICALALTGFPSLVVGQYFGKNTVRYQDFDFQILETEHFDIYYYEDWEEHNELIGALAERWYYRLSRVLDHELTRRQPLILYASHPHFRQTNTRPGNIGEGVGGFTEIFRNRVVMPFGATLGDTDHVLGHEVVHAFQFDMTGRRSDPEQFGNIPGAIRLPLWLVEGMAEYLSIGPQDSHSAMWLRDLLMREEDELDSDMLRRFWFQPYRHGHALLAYVGGRFGDDAIAPLLISLAVDDPDDDSKGGVGKALGIDLDELIEEWISDAREMYGEAIEQGQRAEDMGRVLRAGRDGRLPQLNLAPALSPDGRRLIFLGRPDWLRLELYMLDTESGEIIERVSRAALDPHIEALQFVRSSGDWSPDGQRFVHSTVARGQPALEIIDHQLGKRLERHRLHELDEIFSPAWSPDGTRIAFSAMQGGVSDLFIFNLEDRRLERLTDDHYSALQPVWSPDGSRLVFVTDRFGFNVEPAPRRNDLAEYDLASGYVSELPGIPGAKHINPAFSNDGEQLYFLSDATGTSNIYRMRLADGSIRKLTDAATGIAGLSSNGPALSVAGPNDSLAFTVLEQGGLALALIEDGAGLEGVPIEEVEHGPHLAQLPPLDRKEQQVAELMSVPEQGLPEELEGAVRPYQARIRPEFLSQITLGGGTSAFGTAIGGGASMWWGDMLRDHTLSTQLQAAYIDGELMNNTAVVVGYQNRERRVGWGVIASQIPLISGGAFSGIGSIDDEPVVFFHEQRFWEINRNLVGQLSYPFTRATRLELTGGARQLSFDAQERLIGIALTTGETLIDERRDLPVPGTLTLGTASLALVYDNALFGGTAPALGYRARLEAGGVTGDLDYFSPLIDLRGYWMPLDEFPLTLAGRAMHFGRYGQDAEHRLLRPIFIGAPSLVRGYSASFRLIADPVLERMQGSRIAIGNIEARVPLFGVRGLLGGATGPPTDLNLFYDGGVAWTSDVRPSLLGGERSAIRSYGASIRTNLGGIVLEFSYVNPVDFVGRGWHLQFNLVAGF